MDFSKKIITFFLMVLSVFGQLAGSSTSSSSTIGNTNIIRPSITEVASGVSLPSRCSKGQMYLVIPIAGSSTVNICTSQNTWTEVSSQWSTSGTEITYTGTKVFVRRDATSGPRFVLDNESGTSRNSEIELGWKPVTGQVMGIGTDWDGNNGVDGYFNYTTSGKIDIRMNGSVIGLLGAPTTGNTILGSTTDDTSNRLQVTGGIMQPLVTPASSSATCATGAIRWDASYLYVCTSSNTWKRAALSAF